MHGKERVGRVRAVAVGLGGFIGRHKRVSIAVVVTLSLAEPLLLTDDGGLFVLNLVGLGIGALLLRRFLVRRAVRRPHRR